MDTPAKTLALLIDSDNAQLGYTKQIIQFCERYGTLVIKKAFGDWNQPPLISHHKTVTELGIETIQQSRIGSNATDFRLAMDVGAILMLYAVDIYFIVSNDGDFIVMCQQIREAGAQVYGIGGKSSASKTLRKTCDKFFDIEAIIKKETQTPTKPPPAAKPKPKKEVPVQPKSSPVAKPKPPKAPQATPKPAPPVKSKPTNEPKAPTKPASTKPKPKKEVSVQPQSAPAVKPKPKKETPAPPNAPPVAKPKPKTRLKMLIRAYETSPQENGWVNIGTFANILRELDQHSDQRFADKRLSTWFKEFPETFEVADNHVRMKSRSETVPNLLFDDLPDGFPDDFSDDL